MFQLIQLIIWIVLFAVAAYGLKWVCDTYAMPTPVRWLCGALLLIIILYFIAGQLGNGPILHLR